MSSNGGAVASGGEANHSGEQKKDRKQLFRVNSTSSLFILNTICNPDLDELLLSVSTMLHCQMVRDEEASEQRKQMCSYFHEEIYTSKVNTKVGIPEPDSIYHFLREVFEVGEFHAECAIILLVYINRLIGLIDLPLTASNWKPVTITALIVAQKVWDDNPLANADFSILYPVLTVKQINALELKFLLLLQYKLTVTASLYARYFFELRTICELENRPPVAKSMTKSMADRVEARTKAAAEAAAKKKLLRPPKGTKRYSFEVETMKARDPKIIIS